MFAAQALVLLRLLGLATRWPWAIRCVAAFVLAVATGGAVELVQLSIGRAAEWSDLLRDVLGAAAGLSLASWRNAGTRQRARRCRWGTAFFALVVAIVWPIGEAALGYAMRAYRFPDLIAFATASDRYFLRLQGVVGSPQPLPQAWARAGDPTSLAVDIRSGLWPGIALLEPTSDWSSRRRLVLDLTNPGPRLRVLMLRVHDRAHDNRAEDRFNARLELPPGRRSRFEFPFEQLASAPRARPLDLQAVAGVILYAPRGTWTAGDTFYVTRIRLE